MSSWGSQSSVLGKSAYHYYQKRLPTKGNIRGVFFFFSENDRFWLNHFLNYLSESYHFRFPAHNHQIDFQCRKNVCRINILKVTVTVSGKRF